MKKQVQRDEILLDQMMDIASQDWELTEAKIKKYMKQHNIQVYGPKEPKYLAECHICHKVYNHRRWYAHINT